MKIERVDENTIKCYISLEEMERYQVEYTDFISRSEKAQELMHEIIKQAHDEVGYQPPKLAFEMQIMMVPEQGMVLTFSEKEPFDINDQGKVEAMLSNLMDFVGKLSQYKEKLGSNPAANGLFAGLKNAMAAENKSEKKSDGKSKHPAATEAVFVFSGIAQVMDFADAIPATVRVGSVLYKMNDNYFLHLSKGSASYEKYSRACVQALEFSSLYRADAGCDEILKEHGECIIKEKALKMLRG